MPTISLTDKEYDQLTRELGSLYSYQWNSDFCHADDCGSKVLGVIEDKHLQSYKVGRVGYDEQIVITAESNLDALEAFLKVVDRDYRIIDQVFLDGLKVWYATSVGNFYVQVQD